MGPSVECVSEQGRGSARRATEHPPEGGPRKRERRGGRGRTPSTDAPSPPTGRSRWDPAAGERALLELVAVGVDGTSAKLSAAAERSDRREALLAALSRRRMPALTSEGSRRLWRSAEAEVEASQVQASSSSSTDGERERVGARSSAVGGGRTSAGRPASDSSRGGGDGDR